MAGASYEPYERECAVCTNDFTTPKILPCGHLLCRECVISWLDSKSDAGCPLCRCPIAETQDKSNRNSADVTDALPTDFVMEELVDSARVLAEEHICYACDDLKAEFICIQCLDMMCSPCYKIHKRFSATSSHDVESLSTVTPERLAASRPAPCADHGDKQAHFFCANHGVAVCKSCKSKKHRECSKVNDLHVEIESAQNSLEDLTKILVQAEQKLEQAMGQLTSRLQEISRSEDEDMAQVDKTCERLRKLVDDFRNKLKKNICASHLKIWNSSYDIRAKLSERLGRVMSHKQILSRAKAVAPRAAVIQVRKVLKDKVNSLKLSADLEADAWATSVTSARGCKDVAMRIDKGLQKLTQQISKPEMQHCSYSSNTGNPASLTSDLLRKATRKEFQLSFSHVGVTVCKEALKTNVLHQLQLDEGLWGDKDAAANVYFGVAIRLPSVVHVHLKDIVLHSWRKFNTKASTAGLMIDSSNHLHFYLDGREIETEKEAVPRPCYAVFQLDRCGEASVSPMSTYTLT